MFTLKNFMTCGLYLIAVTFAVYWTSATLNSPVLFFETFSNGFTGFRTLGDISGVALFYECSIWGSVGALSLAIDGLNKAFVALEQFGNWLHSLEPRNETSRNATKIAAE